MVATPLRFEQSRKVASRFAEDDYQLSNKINNKPESRTIKVPKGSLILGNLSGNTALKHPLYIFWYFILGFHNSAITGQIFSNNLLTTNWGDRLEMIMVLIKHTLSTDPKQLTASPKYRSQHVNKPWRICGTQFSWIGVGFVMLRALHWLTSQSFNPKSANVLALHSPSTLLSILRFVLTVCNSRNFILSLLLLHWILN